MRNKSFMDMIKSKELKTDSCGTPIFYFFCGTSMGINLYPLMTAIKIAMQ